MMNTAAWRSLTPSQRSIYIEIAARYTGINNGYISLSVREAAALCHINKDTASRALKVLQERGFIEISAEGAFGHKKRHATEWRLTIEDCDRSNTVAKKTFANWGKNSNLGPNPGRNCPKTGTPTSEKKPI